MTQAHRVVIVGGGFGGLYAAKELGKSAAQVTLIDKRNFHLFQPLLYQVATGTLSPADISSPLRGILSKSRNVQVLMDEVTGIDPEANQITLRERDQKIDYDSLIVATGVSHHYFGNDQWKPDAPGLKTIEDALEIRRRIFVAFEAAEKEPDPEQRKAWLTFVIVGGGPTGVELAGAIAELAFNTLKDDFRTIDTTEAKILLVEGLDRVLPPYPPELSEKAAQALARLGVTVQTKSLVSNIADHVVTIKQGDEVHEVPARTILWAAGVKASTMGKVLEQQAGATLDRVGRVMVEPDLSVPGYPNIFVVGDLANYMHQGDRPLPGVAPVAVQEGKFVAKLIKQRLAGAAAQAKFVYDDAGSLAVIGQNEAVVNMRSFKLSGPPAWFLWIFAHIYYLIEFDNKLIVTIQWMWNYFTRNRGARLITGESSLVQDYELATEQSPKSPVEV
ncbi:MAG: NAD(P)/FAD-dependent oxidoreductase [Pegethrix bostrychoides GSE-TBD4-15B]|jgi:NADH dehydrogenase|uniref:NADH:ubiquinone reductase (non-electrogenic) n=1 Tax=Pegethrix bostrychoides GSE-TBD4-15B TaxID=2839662 RepID=A0A951PDQ8_9CYAN|nr:NAD(P)/FAD-dependent oxidoreductase [Pegethrix bostrychoides GSE-TBD4-15B]